MKQGKSGGKTQVDDAKHPFYTKKDRRASLNFILYYREEDQNRKVAFVYLEPESLFSPKKVIVIVESWNAYPKYDTATPLTGYLGHFRTGTKRTRSSCRDCQDDMPLKNTYAKDSARMLRGEYR